MKFIKDNIKIIIFLLIFIVIIILFTIFFNREVEYSVEYDYNEYHVKESYNKNDDMYSFNIVNGDYSYDISVQHKYTHKRKLINDVQAFDRDDYKCISIKVYDQYSNTICNKDIDYYDNKITNDIDYGNPTTYGDFSVYNDNYDYLVWDGYGFTNRRDNSKYDFLSNESYTNDLSYQFGDYIIVADYDQKREFNKLYIYNHKKNEVTSWDIKTSISFDSYFMGNIGDDLYLFDCESKIQYRMNIAKKKIKVSSKGGKAVFYDNGKTSININELYYNKKLFNNDKEINYLLFDNKLYYRYYKSDKYIRVSDLDVKDIVTRDGNNVYVLSGTKLYKYDNSDGIHLLANYFEWNFNYRNKIYVYSR